MSSSVFVPATLSKKRGVQPDSEHLDLSAVTPGLYQPSDCH